MVTRVPRDPRSKEALTLGEYFATGHPEDSSRKPVSRADPYEASYLTCDLYLIYSHASRLLSDRKDIQEDRREPLGGAWSLRPTD